MRSEKFEVRSPYVVSGSSRTLKALTGMSVCGRNGPSGRRGRHLHRARLFVRAARYPWDTNVDGTPRGPLDDLAAAEKLINDCGYHRRDEELADAKEAITRWASGGSRVEGA